MTPSNTGWMRNYFLIACWGGSALPSEQKGPDPLTPAALLVYEGGSDLPRLFLRLCLGFLFLKQAVSFAFFSSVTFQAPNQCLGVFLPLLLASSLLAAVSISLSAITLSLREGVLSAGDS